MKRRRRSTFVVGIVATLMMALSACGGSNGDSADPKEVSAPTGDPIKIGFICTCSGPFAGATGASDDIFQAWADQVNDNGGLNGYRVQVFIKDVEVSPEKALQAAKELVEKEGVVAISAVSSTLAAIQPYLETMKVPVVGGFPSEAAFSQSPMFFISGTGAVVGAMAEYQQVADAGLKKVGLMYCAEAPVCAEADALGKAAAPLVGVGYASAKISGTQPNYTAQCSAFKGEGVDALFVANSPEIVQKVVADCKNIGYTPTIVGATTTFGPVLLDDPTFDGSLWNGPNANYLDTSIPGVEKMHAALKAYAPKILDDPGFTPNSATAYNAGLLIEAASDAAGGFTPKTTPAEVIDAMYKLKDETLEGTAPPLNFAKGKPGFPTCYFEMKQSGDTLASPNGGKPTCLSDKIVSQLVDIVRG